MKIAVLKFGGTSVADETARGCAMERIAEYLRAGYGVAAVVSAMGRRGAPYATDTLLSLVRGEASQPVTRDLIMSCGETISACVFADALCERGMAAVPMNGMSAMIKTDSAHLCAEVTGMDTSRVTDVLNGSNVAVITGFQGVSPDNEVTTLGRGGSDTSAVCVAGYLGASEAVIYTDVPGVAQCDPRIVPEARFLDEMSCADMLSLARLGAGVVHPRAVEAALRFNIPVYVRSTFESSVGTKLVPNAPEKPGFTGIAIKHDGECDAVSMLYHGMAGIEAQARDLFKNAGITVEGDAITLRVKKEASGDCARELYKHFAR